LGFSEVGTMKNGLYALASLDGAPLCIQDLETMGLAGREFGQDEVHLHRASGFAIRATDGEDAIGSMDFINTPEAIVAFLGYLDEPEDLAGSLGLARNTPPAKLAWGAIERYGADAPARLYGEWSFVRWDVQPKTLTLLSSENCRDPMYVSTNGRRLAISSEAVRLCRLPWIGQALDPAGFALLMSRAALRSIRTSESVWRGVARVVPATTEIFGPGKRTTIAPGQRPTPDLWTGSFEEAVSALTHAGRRIVRQHLSRHRTTAFFLSGGLDSTLLTWMGAEERGAGRDMFSVSSVAPAESDLKDEREFSTAVADWLGVPIQLVCPPETVNAYRPPAATFAFNEAPMAGPRHYLYDALFEAAKAGGAAAAMDGVGGEQSLTNRGPSSGPVSWRDLARSARDSFVRYQERHAPWAMAFHCRFSREILASLPGEWEGLWRARQAPLERVQDADPIGFPASILKGRMLGSSSPAGVRHIRPYRDLRLLELSSRMPAGFSRYGGLNRALGREILRGRVPDSIRLRLTGRPFSPDFSLRISTQAIDALARIPVFRRANISAWLDLDWLQSSLTRVAGGFVPNTNEAFEIQTTAICAEFLLWEEAVRHQ
jgi:asparagine synthase (glutamine-hydrolysing)